MEESDGVGVETEGAGLSEDLAGEGLAGGARPFPVYLLGCSNVSMLCLTGGELLLPLCADEARLVAESVDAVAIDAEDLMGLTDASVLCLTLESLSILGVGDAWLCGEGGAAAGVGGVSLGRGAPFRIVGSGVFASLVVGVLRLDAEVVSLAVAESGSRLVD